MKFKNLLILLFFFKSSLILSNKDNIVINYYFTNKSSCCCFKGIRTTYRFEIHLARTILFKDLKKFIIAELVKKQKTYPDITLPSKSLKNLQFKLYEINIWKQFIDDHELIVLTRNTNVWIENLEN